MSNFLLINKPSGPTSHDVIDQLRKITGLKKIGHAGTLDPFAQGLLLIAIGRESTREISRFVGLDKEYIATLKLGAVSDTYDLQGQIVERTGRDLSLKDMSIQKIQNILQEFIGEIEQIPPMYSAKKVKGKKLYELARAGQEIERKSCKINIYKIEIKKIDIENLTLDILVHCSSGTYIRSLAHDIGQAFGCGAFLEKLVRTKIGDYKLNNACTTEELARDDWQKKIFEL
ncbi:MAG TPA: tRNA pseudouridine(55) synthase TruB [bacterium]|nr:tRNA pseudouridine(55) synthase TruB [bacterium]